MYSFAFSGMDFIKANNKVVVPSVEDALPSPIVRAESGRVQFVLD